MSLFSALRGEMKTAEMEQIDIARILGCSVAHVSNCMCGKAQFRQTEMYAILSALDLPDEDLSRLFPRDGKRKGKPTRPEYVRAVDHYYNRQEEIRLQREREYDAV